MGPLCGTDTPQRYLSESSRIHIFVKSGQIPDGVRHIGFMLKVTRTPPGFEEEFQRLLRQESGQPEYPDYMAGLGRPLGRLQNPMPGMRMPGMGNGMMAPFPGMMPGMMPNMNLGRPNMPNMPMGNMRNMNMGFRPGQQVPSSAGKLPLLPPSRSPGYSDGPPHLSAAYGPERPLMNAPTSFSNAAIEAISRRNQETPSNLPEPVIAKRPQMNGRMRNSLQRQQKGRPRAQNGRQQRPMPVTPQRGMLIPPPIRMKSNNQQQVEPAPQSES